MSGLPPLAAGSGQAAAGQGSYPGSAGTSCAAPWHGCATKAASRCPPRVRADADRKVRHSRILARNIKNATGEAKPTETDAHHLMAAQDERARRPRTLQFKWGVGINDKDNGLYLPKKWSSEVDGLEEATAHEVIHTFAYHLAVTTRLRATRPSNQTEGRKTLCDIKYQILNNEFEY
jgi:hypothetical protein